MAFYVERKVIRKIPGTVIGAVPLPKPKLIVALKNLLEECGLEKGCDLINTDDYDKLTEMIDADSINYSPSRTLTDSEIRMLLDQIRRGF